MAWNNKSRRRRQTHSSKFKKRGRKRVEIKHVEKQREEQITNEHQLSISVANAYMDNEECVQVWKEYNCIDDSDISIGCKETHSLQDRKNAHKGFEFCCNCNYLLHIIPSESRLVCMNCAESSEHMLAVLSNIKYGEDATSVVHVYMREKNFATWLHQYHEDQEEIPYDVLLQVKREYKTRHVKSPLEVKATPIKEILKKLGLSRYKKHAGRIAAILNGQAIPQFSTYEIEQFLAMFRAIQIPFLKIKGINRRNFLSASYLVCKFARLRGWDHFAVSQNMLKSRSVLIAQDKVWLLICRHLGIEFHRSV